MRFGLAVPVLGLVAGAACGVWRPDLPAIVPIAVALASLLLARHARQVRSRALLAAAVFGVAAAGGDRHAVRAWRQAWRPSLRVAFDAIAHDARVEATRAQRTMPEESSAPVVLSGTLTADAAPTTSGTVSLAVDVEWIGRIGSGPPGSTPDVNPVRGGVLLSVLGALGPDRIDGWRAGQRIRAPADLRRAARYLDPGVPDQERALARRGVTLVGTVKSAALVELLEHGGPLDEAAARVRAFTRRAVAASAGSWSPRAAAIVSAILIGDRTGLDDEIERRLQEAGTYHVIAISGGNIAILAALTLALFRVAGMLGRLAMLSAAVALASYGFVVSGGASVSRAVLMAIIYFLARAWDLRGPPFQTLILTAGILLIVDPLSVVDAGALLTFGATAGLVAAAGLVSLDRIPAMLRPAAGLLVATIAAEASLLPVAATVFGRVTVAGLVLNFAAIPLMAAAQLAGMALVPLYLLSPGAARLAGWGAYIGAEGLVRSAELVTLAPWSTWRVAAPPPVVVAAYYAALVVTIVLWRADRVTIRAPTSAVRLRRARFAAIVAALASGAWIVVDPQLTRRGDGRLHLLFVDVGQGDAALVRLPQGASLLIDAGGLSTAGGFDIGDRVVGPVLRHEGVRRLSALVLSHGDADHVGGAPAVLREFRPWDVWDGVPVPPSEAMRRLREEASAADARWTTVQRMDRVSFGEVQVAIRHPPLPDWERQDVRNEDSVVVELRWRELSVVFAGDIGLETEAAIAGDFPPARLRVLKVPHHGSLTSSTEPFVRALAPDVAVISVGRGNNFGHPSPIVLRRYEDLGTAIFRTDRDGAVSIDSDGTSLDVSTYLGRRMALSPTNMHHEVTKVTSSKAASE